MRQRKLIKIPWPTNFEQSLHIHLTPFHQNSFYILKLLLLPREVCLKFLIKQLKLKWWWKISQNQHIDPPWNTKNDIKWKLNNFSKIWDTLPSALMKALKHNNIFFSRGRTMTTGSVQNFKKYFCFSVIFSYHVCKCIQLVV